MEYTTRFKIDVTQEKGIWRAVHLGHGSFADVFRVKLMLPTNVVDDTMLVAKIFKSDNIPNAERAYETEVKRLEALSKHENIVRLKAAERRRPPTFVCHECGDVFHVTNCPQCGEDLCNQSELPSYIGRDNILECRGSHVYDKSKMEDWKLQSKRPCGHVCPCDIVNFAFTQCIYLEELDITMGDFLKMLSLRPEVLTRNKLQTVSDRQTQPHQWYLETFLMRLSCLYKIADTLDYVHRHGDIHGDLAPENIMISFSQPSKEGVPPLQTPKLIDFGQARRLDDVRMTVLAHARVLYVAPEVKTTNSALGNNAQMELPSPGDSESACYLNCQLSLAPGDFVSDSGGGGYEVLEEVESPESLHGTPGEVASDPQNHSEDDDELPLIPFDVQDVPAHNRERRNESVQPRFMRRYRMRVHRMPQTDRLNALAYFANYATTVPADIYAFGMVALEFLTGGDSELMTQLQSYVDSISNMPGASVRIVSQEFRHRIADALPLLYKVSNRRERQVLTDIADDISLILVKCLVRGEGAYARGRSWGFEEAASKLAKELHSVYERLYFFYKFKENYKGFLLRFHQDAAHKIEDAEKLRKGAERELELRNQEFGDERNTWTIERTELRRKQAELENALASVSKISSALSQDLEESRRKAENQTRELQELYQKLQAAQLEVQAAEKRFAQGVECWNGEREQIEQHQAVLRSRFHEQISQLNTTIAAKEEAYSAGVRERDALTERIRKLEQEGHEISKKNAEAGEQIEILSREIEVARAGNAHILEPLYREITAHLAKIGELEAEHARMQRELDEHNIGEMLHAEQLHAEKKKADELEQKLKELNQKIEVLRGKEVLLTNANKELERQRGIIASREKKIEELNKQNAACAEREKALESRVAREQNADVGVLSGRIENIKSRSSRFAEKVNNDLDDAQSQVLSVLRKTKPPEVVALLEDNLKGEEQEDISCILEGDEPDAQFYGEFSKVTENVERTISRLLYIVKMLSPAAATTTTPGIGLAPN